MNAGQNPDFKQTKTFLTAPLLVGVILLIFTLIVWRLTFQSLEKRNETLFKSYVVQIEHQLKSRMETYLNTLLQTRSMFYVTREVDRDEFRQYVSDLELLSKYPGIQGLGFSIRLKPNDLAAHISKIKANGYPDYKIWPSYPRSEYFSIIYLEPMNWRNKRAIGFDMFTDPVRNKSMELARNTGLPSMSDMVELVQETKEAPQKGFLIYVPVYENGYKTEDVEQRKKSLFGFVYAPFRSDDLFKQILYPFKKLPVSIEIKIGENQTLWKGSDDESSESFQQSFSIDVAQKTWQVKVFALPLFSRTGSQHLPWIFLIFGILVSILTTWVLLRNARNSSLNQEKSFQFNKLNEVGRLVAGELDLEKLIQSVTDIGLELSRGQFGAFFYNSISSKGEALMLYTLSGAKREDFDKFPHPRATEVFAPTFQGEGTVISSDITKDPRYGKNKPNHGMPEGHLAVKSYLAVSVISRSGEVLGGLFYGHPEVSVFGEREKNLIEGIASQAAVAIDNARLFEQAKFAIEARDEFLNIASHELKTPITSMKLQFQTAQRMIDGGNEKVFEKTAVIKRIKTALTQLDRMNNLIEEMLDSSRASLSKLGLKQESVEVGGLVQDVLERFHEQFSSRDIPLEIQGYSKKLLVRGDDYRLEQVLSNLLGNAIKYGNGQPVMISVSENEGFATIKVQDNGIGISPISLPQIFQRYERAISSNNISGLGLGLYITKKIIDSHNGRIEVESVLGEGSSFTVYLPLIS
ncbi:MAG: CHASE domain-containing protein [Bdellovibrionales bacterium]|nr:CHASE domain-containing protein [Bdellovibrionales bacterium]